MIRHWPLIESAANSNLLFMNNTLYLRISLSWLKRLLCRCYVGYKKWGSLEQLYFIRGVYSQFRTPSYLLNANVLVIRVWFQCNLSGNLRRRLPAFLTDFWAEMVDMLLRVSAVVLQKITISEWHQNIYASETVFQPVPQKVWVYHGLSQDDDVGLIQPFN